MKDHLIDLFVEHHHWLLDNTIEHDEHLLELLEAAIDKNDPKEIWDRAIDFWHSTDWDANSSLPETWQNLYEAIDEYRTRHGIDSTL